MPSSRHPRQRTNACQNSIDVLRDDHGFVLSLDRSIIENPILHARKREVRRFVKGRLKALRLPACCDAGCRFPIPSHVDERAIHAIAEDVNRQLAVIASRPLSSKLVESLLGITARERLRWSKDGRLPLSGSATFMKGTRVTVATHAAEGILALTANPSIIAVWRESDATQRVPS